MFECNGNGDLKILLATKKQLPFDLLNDQEWTSAIYFKVCGSYWLEHEP